MLIIRRLEPSLQCQLVLDITFSYHSVALMSEATRFTTMVGVFFLTLSIPLCVGNIYYC
jgi:hypothetical protein